MVHEVKREIKNKKEKKKSKKLKKTIEDKQLQKNEKKMKLRKYYDRRTMNIMSNYHFIIFPQKDTPHTHNHSEPIMKLDKKSIALNLNKAIS